jgi:hypothetical protein
LWAGSGACDNEATFGLAARDAVGDDQLTESCYG